MNQTGVNSEEISGKMLYLQHHSQNSQTSIRRVYHSMCFICRWTNGSGKLNYLTDDRLRCLPVSSPLLIFASAPLRPTSIYFIPNLTLVPESLNKQLQMFPGYPCVYINLLVSCFNCYILAKNAEEMNGYAACSLMRKMYAALG